MTRTTVATARRGLARRRLVALVALALAASAIAGARPLWRAGRTPEARWQRIEQDVRSRLGEAFVTTRQTAATLAKLPEVARALGPGVDGTQELFRAIEQHVRHPAPTLAITIFDAAGVARAWHGRPSELSGIATIAPAGAAATASALGFRIVRFEPIVEAARRRSGTVVVEQVIAQTRVGGLTSDTFEVSTPAGEVWLRPASRSAAADADFSFSLDSPEGERVVLAFGRREALQRDIDADRERALAIVTILLAVALALAAGPIIDALALARSPGAATLYAAAAAALFIVGRLLLWFALPRVYAPAAASAPAGLSAAFLRSEIDLCLSAALVLGLGALLATLAGRARLGVRHTRRWPSAGRVTFVLSQVAGAAIATALLAGCDVLLARSVAATGIDSLMLSLRPWSAARWISLFGAIVLQIGAVWVAAAVLALALAPWRIARRSTATLLPAALWLLVAGLIVAALWRGGVRVTASFVLAAAIAGAAGLLAPRFTTRYRRAGPSTRLLAFAVAFLVPALLAYPALLNASQDAIRSLVEQRYSRETLRHRDELLETLRVAQAEIDRIPNLRDLLRADAAGAVSTERAFIVWSQTALAQQRLTSAVELYSADGRLISRFALNFPEYDASAQVMRGEACTWQVFGEARPFGAEERAALHAERALCDAGGSIAGSVVVHVMLDYSALPFISPESPYREVFRAGATGRDAGRPRQIALVIYGWGLLPIYSSGAQVWPIDEPLFERIYASRAGFWTELSHRGENWHLYFANDRSGVYALGYPALSPFDHLVHLSELAMLAVLLYVTALAAAALFNRIARGRAWTGRALLRDLRASFYRKLLIAFVAAALIPVLALAAAIRAYVATRLRADVNAEASRTASVAQHALEEIAALLRLAGLSAPPINDDLMVEVSRMIGRDVNVFEGPSLIATSQRDLFASGLLPTRTPEDVYRGIVLQRQPTFVGEDTVGALRYLVAAAPVRFTGRDAIVTVPLASRQQEIEREIDDLDRGLLLAVLLFIAVGAAIGLPTAERIADPIRRLTRASRRVAAGDLDTRVAVRSIDELRRLVDAFNHMAAELKAQQQQLERTHRLEAWAEMARQVAHEIKNPLTPIQLSAEHLRRVHADRGEPLSPVLDNCVESILGQVRLLRQIAAEFSSFASSPTARPAPVDVPALLDEVVAPYRTGLDGRVELRVEAPATLPHALADRVLIARALTNIIENALHAMPGAGALRVAASADDAHVVLTVEDTGVGMDEEALSRVFEPYFSTKATGTGLGLTIAARNVELSGGTIAVASRKGAGTTVTIRLRRAQ
ncbi:MAG TPA: ATP-binding protein [Vicinamibacterales bacterium]|nr:ATP-binding protein [Vicinamibacterales bacterium]